MANRDKKIRRARHKAGVAGRVLKSKPEIAEPEGFGALTIGTVRKGLPTKLFKTVAANLEMSDRQLAGVLKIPERTMDRRLREGVLTPEESDRLARVARILQRAHEVFGNVEKARGWLNTRLAAFEGETPLQRADTSLGASQIEDVLGRIDHGVYS
jgi:putative toxin-antitoxin system antitoxin component (TIGR02293 family)